MSSPYYKNAQAQAQKEFRACVSHGEHPYLPLLDDFLPPEQWSNGTDLGLCQIPAELIVGTRTNTRANAFARNFMPLLPEGSEFSDKWSCLCRSHLDEGIRDPVKVYEYLNRFYVEEGNKRVSVLKYFDSPTINANVIRLLPERNGSKETELYYEFLDYYRCTRLNYPEFSKPGSYGQFLRLLGSEPDAVWTEDERIALSTVYYYFRQAYEASGGKRLASTVGDALLAYIRVYGYQDLRGKNAADIRKAVSKVWEEITLQQEMTPVDIKLEPTEEKQSGLLSKVITKAKTEQEPMRVAFVYDKAPEESGWIYAHELGRRHVDQVFQGSIKTTAYNISDNNDPFPVLEQAVGDGNTVLFTASPRLLPASLRAAVEYPKAMILNCSLNQSHRYIRTYYARMYEVKFIIGAIAGVLSGGDSVGYICDYPIYGQIAGINAFAFGVQMVSPNTKVLLEWSSIGDISAALKRLTESGVRIVSSQDLSRPSEQQHFGLYQVSEEGRINLALPVWNWGVYYEALLRRIRDKSLQSEYVGSNKALNYYWGMSAGVVDLFCSNKLPDSVKRLASTLRDGLCAGYCDPFRGPLYAQGGRQTAKDEQVLSAEQIIGMDWLAENVIGAIPVYDELNETGKTTVGIAGVESSAKEKQR